MKSLLLLIGVSLLCFFILNFIRNIFSCEDPEEMLKIHEEDIQDLRDEIRDMQMRIRLLEKEKA